VELKKKELETEGKEDAEEPGAERDGLSGGNGDGEGWWVWRVRIVSVPVLIDLHRGRRQNGRRGNKEIRLWRC
jgi:hypothetical protein